MSHIPVTLNLYVHSDPNDEYQGLSSVKDIETDVSGWRIFASTTVKDIGISLLLLRDDAADVNPRESALQTMQILRQLQLDVARKAGIQ